MTQEEEEELTKILNQIVGNSWPRWNDMKIEDKIDSLAEAVKILILEAK